METVEIIKSKRVLDIYSRLQAGKIVKKNELAEKYGVSEKSIQRDIDTIRDFLSEQAVESGIDNGIIYDRAAGGYKLESLSYIHFTNEEAFALCKILLDSRAFTKKTMTTMLNKLIDCCVPKENQKLVNNLVRNEAFHYIPPQHNSEYLHKMWTICEAINDSRVIEIKYRGLKGSRLKDRKVEPLAIMFSEYYFYLVAFLEDIDRETSFANPDDPYPTIYRIDRIEEVKLLEERYKIPYKNRFEEGEFRKRIQFMFGGRLRKIKFEYTGMSVEAVLDRLPTAKIISKDGDTKIIEAEIYGTGINMFLFSQAGMVQVLSPPELIEEIRLELERMTSYYSKHKD